MSCVYRKIHHAVFDVYVRYMTKIFFFKEYCHFTGLCPLRHLRLRPTCSFNCFQLKSLIPAHA